MHEAKEAKMRATLPPMGADLEQRTSPDRSAGNSLKDKILADAAIERAIAATRPKRNPQ
jgi:hypothetical protein